MGKSDNTAEKMESSKDKGFIPLMNFVADTFNSEIVDRLSEDFEFQWIGVDEEDEDQRMERDKSALEAGIKTVNEVRKSRDLEVIPAQWADAPANAQLIQVFMAESGLGQQQDPNADPNDPNAEADIQQAQADDQHEKGKEMADDGHEKELEKMDKQHEQTIEAKKLDHAHQLKMESVKAANAQKMAKDKPKDDGKKAEKPSEDPDDKHDKELEKMDIQHKQNLKEKQVDHKNNVELEKVKAKSKPKPAIKKSLTSEDEMVTVTISWDDY
jgi:hypothetical protein